MAITIEPADPEGGGTTGAVVAVALAAVAPVVVFAVGCAETVEVGSSSPPLQAMRDIDATIKIRRTILCQFK